MKKGSENVSTGISGLDEVCKGGFRRGSSILIAGAPGTGKSIFAMQFMYAAAKRKEATLFISSEEPAESIREYMSIWGKDANKLEEDGLITLIEQRIFGGKMISMEAPMTLIRKKKIKLLILDSLTLFECLYSPHVEEYRRGVLEFLFDLKEAGVTILATSERHGTSLDAFPYKVDDSLFDAIVLLTKVRKGSSFERVLNVAKLRGKEHGLDIYPFTITKNGLSVFPKEIPFSLIEKDIKNG